MVADPGGQFVKRGVQRGSLDILPIVVIGILRGVQGHGAARDQQQHRLLHVAIFISGLLHLPDKSPLIALLLPAQLSVLDDLRNHVADEAFVRLRVLHYWRLL